jgi:hypothetical protein
MKKCSDCHEIKSAEMFSKASSKKDGLHNICKNCDVERIRKYRKNNPEKVKETRQKYYKNNIEKIRETQQKYYTNNIEKIREIHQKYYKNNAEKIREQKLINNYGLTTNDYENLLNSQKHKCAICGTNDPGKKWMEH